MELLDNKCYMKLVDIAHSLLKMAPYDQVYSNYLIGKNRENATVSNFI